MRRQLQRVGAPVGALAGVLALAAGAPAGAVTFGSPLGAPANTSFGCEALPIPGAFGGVNLVPSGATTCTWQHGGYANQVNRRTSLVPRTGRITRIRVRSGAAPAPLRITIMRAFSEIAPDGSSIPGSFRCCTGVRLGPTFRPRANAVTTVATRLPVTRVVDRRRGLVSTDAVAVSALGPGTLPIADLGGNGDFATGSPQGILFAPLVRPDQARLSQSSMDGFEVLLQWEWRPPQR